MHNFLLAPRSEAPFITWIVGPYTLRRPRLTLAARLATICGSETERRMNSINDKLTMIMVETLVFLVGDDKFRPGCYAVCSEKG